MQTDVIYCGDNLSWVSTFPAESVDLIYLDPPFFSNRQYEVIWGDEAEVRSFEDRWQGGIQVYVGWMNERAIELRRVLKDTGSLYLHCDAHASHYLKVMLDEVFGQERFLNEVTWKRTHSHGNVGRNFGSICDTLLIYTKSATYTWNQQHTALSAEYVRSKFTYRDPDGRRWRSVTLRNPSVRPNLHFPFTASDGATYEPHRNGWSCNRIRLERYDAEQRLHFPAKHGGQLNLKMYLDESPGIKLQTLWADIPPINSQAKERLGYPTQKPEALLARIIETSSNKGDIVLDPFAGCGTATVVADQLQRQWIGIDISPTAVEMMRRRLLTVGATGFKIVGMPVSVEALRHLKPFEFQNWVIAQFNGTHSPRKSGDMGIDGYSFFLHEPIQVKQSDHIGRNVIDNFETAVQRAGKLKGSIVGFSFTKGAYEEVARAKATLGLEIELVTVGHLLRDVKSLITPVGGRGSLSVPLPPARPANTLPSVDDLIQSDRQSA